MLRKPSEPSFPNGEPGFPNLGPGFPNSGTVPEMGTRQYHKRGRIF